MSLKNLLESLDKISESAYFKTTSTGREVTVGGKKATVLGQLPTNQGSAKYYAIRFADKKYPGDTFDQIHANKIFDQLGEAAKPDFLDLDGDGNKTEPMKAAAADKKDLPFDPDETPSSDKDEFGNTIKHRARHLARKGMKQASGVKEGDITKTATGRIHRAKAGGYGRKIDRDDDSGDRFHSSDIDDTDDEVKSTSVKRGRGRPMKGGDSETGEVKKWDTDTLASWIIGNKPKTLPKGVSTTKHKLKDWMERVESTMLAESIISEGAMKELSALIDDVKSGELDVYDILSGKYQAMSKVEDFFAKSLQRKYDAIAGERGLHADDDHEKIINILIDEIDSVLSEDEQVSIEPAKTTAHVIKQGNQVLGQVENPQLANTIKQAIGQGQMSLAGSNLKEGMESGDSGLQSIIMLFPHEHKMAQDGWGMDTGFADVLADYYHKQGKIPHTVWRGSPSELMEFVQDCYAKDTQPIMGEAIDPEDYSTYSKQDMDALSALPSSIKVNETPSTNEEQLDEVLPIAGAIAAGAGTLGRMAASTVGRAALGAAGALRSEPDYEDESVSEGPDYSDIPASIRKQRGDNPLSPKDVLGSKGNLSDIRTLNKLSGDKPGKYHKDFEKYDEAVGAEAVDRHSMKGLLSTLDEYAKERIEPTVGEPTIRSAGTRSDGSDRLEPRYTGPKMKSSPSSRSSDNDSFRMSRPRYMEEEQVGEKSPITGDEKTTIPKPMKPMYPTGKENKMKTYDVVSDKMSKKEMYESKSTIKKDEKAERAGKKVTKDLEYDMKHQGKDDTKAERAGKRVTKDIEYDEKHNVNEGKFSTMDADLADLSPEEFKKEYGMTKAEARAKHGGKEPVKKLDEMDNPDWRDDIGKKEVMVKPITVKKMKKDTEKEMNKAFGKAMPKKKVKESDAQMEAWDTDYKTPESEKGKYKGKTVAELKKMKAELMKKEKRTKTEQGKVAELNFAIRAKQADGGKWGKIKETDAQMESWDKKLSSLLTESVTVNTSTGTDPETKSVNISATGEDADQLMAMLQNAGLHASPTTGGYQQLQYDSSEQVCEETTDAEFMIPEDKEENESDNQNTATYRNGKEYDGTGSPAVTTKTPGSDPHNKFDDAEDVPIMAMPRGMGVSQNVEDELAEVVEPVTPQDVIGELDAEDSANDDMSFIKKVINHGASQYGDSAPNDGEKMKKVGEETNQSDVPATTSTSPISGEMGKTNVSEVEADVEEGNEFSGALAQAKSSGAKEFEVDGKKYPVKEDGEYWAEETNEGYEDGNWAAMRSDDKIQDADAEAYRAGADTTNRDPNLAVTEDPAGGRKGDDDLADPTFAGKNRQARVTEDYNDSPVVNAITRRIMMQRADLLQKYGPEKVLQAIEDVADFVGDAEEIGSSDVSGWIKQVADQLKDSMSESKTCNECGSMYEGEGHKCGESLNEWANSPMGQSEDEEFETDMDFMTKVISGGLNNQKQDQTTLPSTRVRTGAESAPRGADMSIGAELKRLAGIN